MKKKHKFTSVSSLSLLMMTTMAFNGVSQQVKAESTFDDNLVLQKSEQKQKTKLSIESQSKEKPSDIPDTIISQNSSVSLPQQIKVETTFDDDLVLQKSEQKQKTELSIESQSKEKPSDIPEIIVSQNSSVNLPQEIKVETTFDNDLVLQKSEQKQKTELSIESQSKEKPSDIPDIIVSQNYSLLESNSSMLKAQAQGEEAEVLVGEVFVAGVEGELKDLIYNVINTEPGRTVTRSSLQQDVDAIYATGFFSRVDVDPEDTPLGVRITFQVQANPVLERVVIETLPAGETDSVLPPEVVEESFAEQYGEILNLRDIQDGVKEINKWYTDNGYDLAQVVGAPRVSPNGTVTLIIAEGVLEDIQVKFFDEDDDPIDGKTREFIVTREMQLEPGEVFNRETARNDLQRIFGLGIFQDVRLSFAPGDNPSEVVMNVEVVETNTGSLAAGAGISSSSGFFGTISYQQQNLGGNNQTLATELQLGERELLFDVSFTDPWIAGDPYRTSYTVNGFRRRSISLVYDGTDSRTIRTERRNDSPRVVRTGGGVSFTRPLSEDPFTPADWIVTAGVQYQHVKIQDADGRTAPRSSDEFGNQKLAFNSGGIDDLVIFRLSATQDNRNSSIRPTSGSLLLLGMDQTAPITNIVFNRIRGSYSYYIPVDFINFDFTEGPQALAFNIQSGTVLGDLPPYEAFVIGGSNSVRGYGEGDLANGRSYLQATAEYRFPIISFLGGALFFDYGTNLGSGGAVIGQPSKARDLPGDGFGYGLGVRVQSPVGPIRIDYAINDDGDNRIHFGIGEKF